MESSLNKTFLEYPPTRNSNIANNSSSQSFPINPTCKSNVNDVILLTFIHFVLVFLGFYSNFIFYFFNIFSARKILLVYIDVLGK